MTHKSARKIFSENLLSLLRQKGIDQKQLAMDLDISPASVTHWIKENKYPRIGKLEEIAEYFEVPMSRLTQNQTNQNKEMKHYDADTYIHEQNIIDDIISTYQEIEENLKDLSENNAPLVNNFIEEVLKEQNEKSTFIPETIRFQSRLSHNRQQVVLETAQTQLEEQNNVISIEEYKECNEVSIVGRLAAGKGTSNFDKTRPIDIVNVRTEEIPDGYDLAFQIVGDSMEPHFKDGEIAYVKELCEFVDKKIYAVEVNHEAFIKKVYRTSEGYSLVSLNNDTDKDGKLIYPPITISDTDDFHIIGKVL